MKKIQPFEPVIFLFFGLFHMHRIWGLFDRAAYADFWMGCMEQKGLFYFLLMGILAALCIWGIMIFFMNLHKNFWWRWVYLLCGGYLLFDLFAIAARLDFWHELILRMYDTSVPYWNVLWSSFVLLGAASLILGIKLMIDSKRGDRNGG